MKRLFSLLLILCSLSGLSQTVIQRAGAANTVNDPRHMASLNSFQPTYSDTVHANQFKGVDSVGAIIYTEDIKGFWYRQGNPKKWVRFSDIVSQTVNNITLLTDNSVRICTGDQSCDTLIFETHIENPETVYVQSDTTIVVCDALSNCDTIAIPKQNVYLFQNGLTTTGGVTEWGGTLLHNTEIYGGEKTITFRAHPVYNYVFKVQNMQRYSDGTGLQSWLSAGNGAIDTARDYGNQVRLGLNYTGAAYPAGATNLPGYFGDKIGYFLGTNTTGAGSYGLSVDDDSAKVGGLFFHTLDRNYTDAVTIYGKAAPNASLVAQIASGQTLAPDRIATFHNDRNLTFYGYDSTSRNDGVLTKVLGTDASGNVILGRIAAASVSGGTDSHFANTDLSATGSRSHNFRGYDLTIDSVGTYQLLSRAGGGVSGYYAGGGVSMILAQRGFPLPEALHRIDLSPDSLTFVTKDRDQPLDVRWRNLPYSSSPSNKYLLYDTITRQMTYGDPSVSPSADTSGRTYYALNGLSARNDSTFKLGGYLDEATRIKGLNTHFIVLDSLSGFYVNTDYSGYKINTTQQDYYEVVQTHKASGEIRNRFYWNTSRMYFENLYGDYSFANLDTLTTDDHYLVGIDQNDLIFKSGGIKVLSGGDLQFSQYPNTRSDGVTTRALYVSTSGDLLHDYVASTRAWVYVVSATTYTIANGGDYIYNGGAATWTLPAVAASLSWEVWIKNTGSGAITLSVDGGGTDLYTSAAAASITIAAGEIKRLVNDGTYWQVYSL
jgi:hypothetical protein